jgi:glycosyltransferase involved in cell wall biosynthesis
MSGLAAARAAHKVDVPVALTYHALGIDKRRHQGSQDTSPDQRIEIEGWLARHVDQVIATSAEERRTLAGLGADVSRVSVVPCGVDLERFRTGGDRWERSARHRVVCVSRLVPRKGILDVVTALAPLDDVELLVAGGPPWAMLGDDPHAAEISSLAAELGSSDRVTLLGAVDRLEVPALLRSADIVCCTPWYEPFGLVAVEAMACGVPVVASAVGGLAETVVHGCTGILVPPRRPGAIREAVATLLERPGMRELMQIAAAHRAESYGWPVIAAETMATYRRLIKSHRAITYRRRRPPTLSASAPDQEVAHEI